MGWMQDESKKNKPPKSDMTNDSLCLAVFCYTTKQLRLRRNIFCPHTLSKVSVCGSVAALLHWACVDGAHMTGAEEDAHFRSARKKREMGSGGVSVSLWKANPKCNPLLGPTP